MKKEFFAYCIAAACLLTACGDDSSTGPATNISSGVSQISSSSTTNIPTSSATESSDSKVNSSSSQGTATNPSGYPANYNPTTGALTDERDGVVYKTAKIGNQIWMAENLRISKANYNSECAPDADNPNEDSIIQKYGLYYTWINAMQLCEYRYKWAQATDSAYHGFRQGLCPKGWHIPTINEWQTLLDQGSVKKLLSTEWDYVNNKGTDDYGFSLPKPTENNPSATCLQTADEYATDQNYMICFQTNFQQPVKLEHIYKYQSENLRCLMD